jgi:hypothetical protein
VGQQQRRDQFTTSRFPSLFDYAPIKLGTFLNQSLKVGGVRCRKYYIRSAHNNALKGSDCVLSRAAKPRRNRTFSRAKPPRLLRPAVYECIEKTLERWFRLVCKFAFIQLL